MSNLSKSEFEIIEILASGAMGEISLSMHEKTGQKRILKSLIPKLNNDKQAILALQSESKILKRLKHPNIVEYFGNIHDKGKISIVMEYITMDNGKPLNLEQLLKQRGTIDLKNTKKIISQVCDAIGYMHKKNILHKDIKAANILMSVKGGIKIIDFGLSDTFEYFDSGTHYIPTTQLNWRTGTYNFFPPPEIQNDSNWTPQSDVFQVGVLTHLMITGRYPILNDRLHNYISLDIDHVKCFVDTAINAAPQKRFINMKNMKKVLLSL